MKAKPQIIVTVPSSTSPQADAIVRALKKEFPDHDISLIQDPRSNYSPRKLWVISDPALKIADDCGLDCLATATMNKAQEVISEALDTYTRGHQQ